MTLKLTDAQIQEIESVEAFNVGFPHDFTGDDPRVTGDRKSVV